jgi:hypothetical protein
MAMLLSTASDFKKGAMVVLPVVGGIMFQSKSYLGSGIAARNTRNRLRGPQALGNGGQHRALECISKENGGGCQLLCKDGARRSIRAKISSQVLADHSKTDFEAQLKPEAKIHLKSQSLSSLLDEIQTNMSYKRMTEALERLRITRDIFLLSVYTCAFP